MDLEAQMRLARQAGTSPDMATVGGIPGSILPPPDLFVLGRITGRQNYDPTDQTKLACFSFDLVRERDSVIVRDPDTDDQVERIIEPSDPIDDRDNYGGDFSSIDPDNDDDEKDTMYPAFELSGNINVPVDGTAIVQLWKARGGRHYWFIWTSGLDNGLFPATLIRKMLVNSQWLYAYTNDSYSVPQTQTQGSTLTGKLPVDIVRVHTQTADGLNPDIWTIKVIGSTGGSYTLQEDGGSLTADIAYDANDAAINALLSVFTCATSTATSLGETTYTHVFTSTDAAGHSITLASASDSPLEPVNPDRPAVFRNNVPMDVPVHVHLEKAAGTKPSVTFAIEQVGNPVGSLPTILSLKIKNVQGGTFRMRFTTDDAWQTLKWNANAAAIQTALSVLLTCTVTGTAATSSTEGNFTITITEDFEPHKLLIDIAKLVGTEFYIEVWSNGNACTGAIGGLDPVYMDGYSTPPTPTTTLTQTVVSAGSTHDTWTLTITDATSGSYDLIFDGGSPVNTAYNSCPTITGTTVTLSDGVCTITVTATTTGHTLVIKPAKLRNDSIPDYAVIVSNKCVKLEPISDCPPSE